MIATESVTVVIPSWRRAAWLEGCLHGLAAQTRQPEEVVVVLRPEDAPAWDVVSAVRNAGMPIRTLEVDRPGHVAPVCVGLHAASGEIVAFLDDDVVPDPDWLEHLLGPLHSRDVACVGGRVVGGTNAGRVHHDAGTVRWYGRHIGNVGWREVTTPVRVAAVMEGNCAWKTDVLRALEFDPRLDFDDASMYGLDLCLQSAALGYATLYTSSARVRETGAPRDPALDRSDRLRRIATYSRNYTIIGLARFRGIRRLTFPIWWFIVGERGAYGILTGLADLLLRGPRVWPEIRRSFAAKVTGVRECLRL